MEYRILGKTGLSVSRLGFGGIPIQKIDAEGTRSLMLRLMDEGVNYVDTARGYTVSEEYLGFALEGIRDRFIIATKSMARTKEAMAKDIDVSLKNLRTDYIDLYQIHNPGAKDLEQVMAPGGALEALQEAKYKAITENGIDILVDMISKTEKRGKRYQATVTGFAGYYKNSRTLYEDIKLLEKVDKSEIEKYLILHNPEVLQYMNQKGEVVNIYHNEK